MLCATPAYLQQRGLPIRPEDLRTHDLLTPEATDVPQFRLRLASCGLGLLLRLSRQFLRFVLCPVALLLADGVIQTDRNPMAGRPPEDSLTPEDVAELVSALLANVSVTGQTVPVDGGMVMD